MKFKLLQIKDWEHNPYIFRDFDTAQENNFSLDDYEVVYEGEVRIRPAVEEILESLFYTFNCQRPKDFKGRLMSVSDVVELNRKYYYCEAFGFKEISKEINYEEYN